MNCQLYLKPGSAGLVCVQLMESEGGYGTTLKNESDTSNASTKDW